MSYTNSELVSYKLLSPNHSGQRTHSIDTITIHEVWGQLSVETLGSIFLPSSRQASSNYGIGLDGRIGMYVEEKNRSWCSGNAANDQRAITIETSNDRTYPNAVNAKAYAALIKLCADICKRNGKKKMVWCGSLAKTNSRTFAADEMRMTLHKWFQNTECPGYWLETHMQEIADKVNAILQETEEFPVKIGNTVSYIKHWFLRDAAKGIVLYRGIEYFQDLIKDVQAYLQYYGYYDGTVDGDFGAVTEAAVKAWQAHEGLKQTGQIGYAEWCLILKG